MSSKRFFKRSYKLILTDEKTGTSRRFEPKTFQNLDIKFKVQKVVNTTKYEAKIDILGLSRDDINLITATASLIMTEAADLKYRIVLTAGYEDHEVGIFSGYIVHATVDSPPNMWLHIEAYNYFDITPEEFDIACDKKMTLGNIFEYTAGLMKLTPQNETARELRSFVPGGFYCRGGIVDVLKGLQALTPKWMIYMNEGLLYAVDYELKPKDESHSGRVIDRESGLLSVAGITFYGSNITTWLNDPYQLSEWITLKSELMPNANGPYRILGKTFVGHFRGKEWYTVYETLRKMN